MTTTDTAFTANGEPTGTTDVAFETKLDGNINIGVGVVGTECGVYGQSRDYQQAFHTSTRDANGGAGVVGRGNIYGVFGESLERGVFGKGSSTGVFGEGHRNSPGVVGLCFLKDEVRADFFGVAGPGVLGVSNANSRPDPAPDPGPQWRAGVVGLSLSVLGVTETVPTRGRVTDLGDGTGVAGISGSGIGVHGRSESGRGGVFESTESPQLQLVPAKRPVTQRGISTETLTPLFPVLPHDGEAGDLIATLEHEPDTRTGGSSCQARLWFCLRSVDRSTNPERAAGWAQVLLGNTFDGG
jgi:hypothetical protein